MTGSQESQSGAPYPPQPLELRLRRRDYSLCLDPTSVHTRPRTPEIKGGWGGRGGIHKLWDRMDVGHRGDKTTSIITRGGGGWVGLGGGGGVPHPAQRKTKDGTTAHKKKSALHQKGVYCSQKGLHFMLL